MSRGYAHRVDLNQQEIVQALRDAGALVAVTSRLGGGFPDLVVYAHGRLTLLEVKRGNEQLTKDEQKFFERWKLAPVYIVRTAEEALEMAFGWRKE